MTLKGFVYTVPVKCESWTVEIEIKQFTKSLKEITALMQKRRSKQACEKLFNK